MCFIILIDLYGTFNFLDPVYLYGDLVYLRFSSFLWKSAPSTKEKRICGSINCFPVLPRRVMHFLPRNQNCLFFYSNIEVGAHELLQVTLGKILWQAHTPMIIINIIIITIIITIIIIIIFLLHHLLMPRLLVHTCPWIGVGLVKSDFLM